LYCFPIESRIRTDAGEVGTPWSLLSQSKWDNNKSYSQQPSNKSKFFDDFALNNTEQQLQPNRSQQRWPSNTHSTQTSRQQEDDSQLPVRQPFFSNDQSYPEQQPIQQNRYQNGDTQHQQRSFYNNRRPPMNNQQRRPGGGNRETFHDNGNSYNNDFDFETSNRKFNKIASEDEFKQTESPNHFLHSNDNPGLTSEFEPIYDKKRSFFDNIAPEDTSDVPAPMYNRFRNQDTFGNDRFQRQRNRGGGFGRSNTNNYRHQQQQGNEDFYYRQNNNGYHYRY
jgi:hypothetical protein